MLPKIAILTNYPADHKTFTGGVETATVALLEGLRKYQDEFEFHVVSLSNSNSKDVREQKNGFWFHFLGTPRYPWLRPRFPFRVIKAYRELNHIKPDLVHCQDNMALALASILSRYPRIFTIHGVKRSEAPKRTGWEFLSASFDAIIEKYIHRRFDSFICISSYAKKIIGNGRLTFEIPNPVRSLFFQMPPYPFIQKNPYFLFIGALAPLKRPIDLILAHAELRRQFPNLETMVCGAIEDAGYLRSMHKIIAEKKIEGVHFLGRVSQENLVDLLKGAVALVLPSTQENSPMTIAEAMAVGVPVVATRVGGVSDMVKHGETGLLCEAGNMRGLTSCMRQLLEDPSLGIRLGDHAREFAQENYLPERIAAATVAAYRQLLNRNQIS